MNTMIGEYLLGDILVRYVKDETGVSGLLLLPKSQQLSWEESIGQGKIKKEEHIENLVQLKIVGDAYLEGYGQGFSMRNSESCKRFLYVNQESSWIEDSFLIRTKLQDAKRKLIIYHNLLWKKGRSYVETWSEFQNHSGKTVSLEMLSSFSLFGITPYESGDAPDCLDLYRIRSAWSAEGRLEIESVEDLGLERSWGTHASRALRFGQVGSLPVNGFFPMVAVCDKKNHVFWGARIVHQASWQLELYRRDDGLSFSGGLGDREFAHWMKDISAGEKFESPKAQLTVAAIEKKEARNGNFDFFCQRFLEDGREIVSQMTEEKSLPVIFNEYCTTWGNPSEENIAKILEAIRGRGISYFVIDCGWYKQAGIPWDRSMGDYEVSKDLFPSGLEKTVERIKKEGYRPGIWFEIENVGDASEAYQKEELLLKRDGYPLTTAMRRFWDMKNPVVHGYLKEKIIDMLKQYGFGYLKIDCNETIGIGCDGAESLGEGLRQNMEASKAFLEELREELPDLVIENCASGGHRLDPLHMSMCQMASFSDAHECVEIPIIAAQLHRCIHPVQSQIWAVIRKEDDRKRIVYSMAASFLGRMCLSGDVIDLKEEQWQLVEAGIQFYQKIGDVLKDGKSQIYGPKIKTLRHPKGYQVVVRETEKECLIVVHVFSLEEGMEEIAIPLAEAMEELAYYREEKISYERRNQHISLKLSKEFSAFAILFQKKEWTE